MILWTDGITRLAPDSLRSKVKPTLCSRMTFARDRTSAGVAAGGQTLQQKEQDSEAQESCSGGSAAPLWRA